MKNLIIRTISGGVFLALFLVALLWHPLAYCVIFTAAVLIMTWEYLRMTLHGREPLAEALTLLASASVFVLFYLIVSYHIAATWLLVPVVLVSLIYTAVLFCKDRQAYSSSPYLPAALLYIALPFALSNLLVYGPDGEFDGRRLLAIMIVIWSSDVGAYLSGMAFGQKNGHRLFPSISPKKSWEGYFGGLLVALAAGWCVGRFGLFELPVYHALILALLVNVSSTIGDLVESQLKRNFGVKDSGRIMPGHGGLLDRFDGTLTALPIAVFYISIFGL